MSASNAFLLKNNLRIRNNPCVSPDFCLDWSALSHQLHSGTGITTHERSRFSTAVGRWLLVENEYGDHAWRLQPNAGIEGEKVLAGSTKLKSGDVYFPATFANLLTLKNLIQDYNSQSTIFPCATQKLGQSTLGIGARFTTLHWPAVEWAMGNLGLGVTANQNSIPRELVYDVDAMLAGKLDTVPFPFIGTNVPEGHQGQSVAGMSHGCVLSNPKTGFHLRGIAWSFNADHQPIGGKFDAREDQLVTGCVLASYITFDLSPELAQTQAPADAAAWVKANVDTHLVEKVRQRVAATGLKLNEADFAKLLAYVWPSLQKMKRPDAKNVASREKHLP